MVSAFECHLRPSHNFLGFSSLNFTGTYGRSYRWVLVKRKRGPVILIIQNVVLLAAHRLIKSAGWKELPAARHVVDHFPKVFIFICVLDVDESKVGLVTAAIIHQTLENWDL